MTLCPECVSVADEALLRDRIKHRGIPLKEDIKWAHRYNQAHSTHSAPPGRKRPGTQKRGKK